MKLASRKVAKDDQASDEAGYHVSAYLPSEQGVTQDEAKRLAAGLVIPAHIIEPPRKEDEE